MPAAVAPNASIASRTRGLGSGLKFRNPRRQQEPHTGQVQAVSKNVELRLKRNLKIVLYYVFFELEKRGIYRCSGATI